jgi:hypothetical protein
MQLKGRTTYLNGWGRPVCIAGHAKRVVDGQQCWWSIQGDHYTDAGRFVYCRLVTREVDGEPVKVYESFTNEFDVKNIEKEDTSEAAARWWDNVNL